MINLVVATHGNFGKELVKSAGMLAGDTSSIKTLSLMPGMSFEDFVSQADKMVSQLEGETLCFVDLFGGTPSNTMSALTRKYPNLKVVTGVNLPILLDTFLKIQSGETDIDELVKNAIDVSKTSAVFTNDKLKEEA